MNPAAMNALVPGQIRNLAGLLRTAKFKVTHAPMQADRVFTIMGITEKEASAEIFTMQGKDGQADQRVSLVDYYKKQYNKVVTKPRLPCVRYGKGNMIP